MDASVDGALSQINISWKAFTHNGKRMTKPQVKAVLEYAKLSGYKLVSELQDYEIDNIINNIK